MSFSVVYVDNVLDQLDNGEAWDLLNKSLRLRVLGYRKEHGHNVLPLGKDDYFSTLVLIYESEKLVCTYKFTRYDMCLRYGASFPMISALTDGNITEHTQQLSSILTQAHNNNRLISYCGGWTIHPDVRNDKGHSREVRRIVEASHYYYFKAFNISEALILGVIKFKADLFQEFLGYKRLENNGEKIGEVKLAFLGFESAHMLHLTESSDAVKKVYDEYKHILDSAKFVIPDATSEKLKAA